MVQTSPNSIEPAAAQRTHLASQFSGLVTRPRANRSGFAATMPGWLRTPAIIIAAAVAALPASCGPVSATKAGGSSRSHLEPPAGCKLVKAPLGVLDRTGTSPPAPGYRWDLALCPGLERNALGGLLIQVKSSAHASSPRSWAWRRTPPASRNGASGPTR